MVAADFFAVEVWTRQGLQRFVVLFFMELSTRKVEIAGIVGRRKWAVDDPDRQESHRRCRRNPEG